MAKYEYRSRIRYSECGEDSCLHLAGVVNYFQDTASFQGEDLGIGVSWMKERHLAWILVSWQIITDHMPRLGERVTVRTWPYSFNSFYGLRNLVLEDEEGHYAAWANSVWVLMDTKNRRPVKVSGEMAALYEQEKKLDMDYAPRHIVPPAAGDTPEPFVIHRGHLDSNHHVNNGQYIQMAMEYLPADFRIYETRVEYREQSFLGEMILPLVAREEDSVTVSLQKESGKVCAIVRFRSRNETDKGANHT